MRTAQALLVAAAGGLWAASRLPWVVIRSFDGLGQPKELAVSGASWSTALLPLALLSLAAAICAVAVRGWPLRVLAVLMSVASLAAGYLAISMWVGADITARGAGIAGVSITTLLSADRRYAGAVIVLASAVGILGAAALLMRSAGSRALQTTKYVSPARRRSTADSAEDDPEVTEISERTLWDALDEGHDPTQRPLRADPEGR